MDDDPEDMLILWILMGLITLCAGYFMVTYLT
jgi:hypothetical protein